MLGRATAAAGSEPNGDGAKGRATPRLLRHARRRYARFVREEDDDDRCELTGVDVMRSNRWAIAGSLAISAAAAAMLAFGRSLLPALSSGELSALMRISWYPLIAGAVMAWHHARRARIPSGATGTLRATASGLAFDGRAILSRRNVSDAYVMPSPDHGTLVRLEQRGVLRGPVDLKVSTLEEGRRLLRVLRIDPTRHVGKMRIASPSREHRRKRLTLMILGVPALFGSVLLLLAMAASWGHGVHVVLAFALIALLLVPALLIQPLVPASVAVGADGVLLQWLWQKRFVRLAEIESVEVVDGDTAWLGDKAIVVLLHLKSGESIDLLSSTIRARGLRSSARGKWALMQAGVLAERINFAIAEGSFREGGEAPACDTSSLGRASRSIVEWVASLRASIGGATTFRSGARLGASQLWGVVEDPQMSPARRAAAAVALGPRLDDAGRARLRVAAEGTVAPKLRVALEAAAEADDDRLAGALDQLDDEDPVGDERRGKHA